MKHLLENGFCLLKNDDVHRKPFWYGLQAIKNN